MKKILLIAGLDPSGNAGLLRDLDIVSRFPLKPLAAVTALTSQNRHSFFSANVVSPSAFRRQLESVGRADAVKIGMLGDKKIVAILVSFLEKIKNKKVVLDPV